MVPNNPRCPPPWRTAEIFHHNTYFKSSLLVSHNGSVESVRICRCLCILENNWGYIGFQIAPVNQICRSLEYKVASRNCCRARQRELTPRQVSSREGIGGRTEPEEFHRPGDSIIRERTGCARLVTVRTAGFQRRLQYKRRWPGED